MFILKQTESYLWPVTVEFPVDGGKFKKETFEAEFKRVSEGRIKEVTSQMSEGELTDMDFAKEILVGWKNINDEDGNPAEFSEAMKLKLLDVPLVSRALVLAFLESLSGAKRKNS